MSGTGEAMAPLARPVHGSRVAAEAGETLIEALVVVAIIGMVAAIGFPQMRQALLTLSRRQAVATVAARLRQARAEALRRDTPVVFAVTDGGTTYGLTGGRPTPTPPGVILASSAARGKAIAFYGDGSSSGGSIWVIAGRQRTAVCIGAGTGVVAVGGS